ncbi:MAG: CRTAC1 family protein [Halobacteria archaeon]|nr:CRTAC1 family protein [Halobacteria archaeon]
MKAVLIWRGWALSAVVMVLLAGCEGDNATQSVQAPSHGEPFVEVAAASGLVFTHFNGASGAYYQPEVFGPGVALLDYDRDGDLDVYLPQAGMPDPGQSPAQALFPLPAGQPTGDRLFRNELQADGMLRFTDVTDIAGLGHAGYAQGVATGDFDNDGYTDLYVTAFGTNVLYHNQGDGRFIDVTSAAGVDDPRWSTSAAFLDYDRDGDLDLFVANYVHFTVAGNKQCAGGDGTLDYCGPQSYRPVRDRLFRNDGNGRFTDVSDAAGLGVAFGPGLGVTCADYNGDGWQDIYVANDGDDNQLWINQGNGRFENTALMAGVAINAYGKAEASMGVTAGDFDNDGDEDLFMTHLDRETNTLYVNDGTGNFLDATDAHKLGRISLPYTGFGAAWLDFDNDSDLDLFIANGAVRIEESLRGQPYPYQERNQLIRNDGTEGFTDRTEQSGPALALVEVSRGAAFGDLDNDGDVDIVVANNNGPTRLLRNTIDGDNHWLTVRLQGTRSNRAGLGARLALLRAGKPPLWRRAHTDGSYLSASDDRVHFGLGAGADVQAIGVVWPHGTREIWHDIGIDSFITLQEGSGKAWDGIP